VDEPVIIHGRIDDMSLQGVQTFHSVGLIEPEGIVPNQSPTIVIYRVDNADSSGPHDDDFSCVRGLKLFKVPDGHGNPRSRPEEFRKEGCHA